MNEYCKEVLYHSWGKAPERKKLERDYNRSYYQKNKHKWGVKSASDPLTIKTVKTTGAKKNKSAGDVALNVVGDAAMLVPGAGYLYGSGENFANYVEEDIEIAGNVVAGVASIPATIALASAKAIEVGKKIAKKILKPFEKFKDPQWWIDWANK